MHFLISFLKGIEEQNADSDAKLSEWAKIHTQMKADCKAWEHSVHSINLYQKI